LEHAFLENNYYDKMILNELSPVLYSLSKPLMEFDNNITVTNHDYFDHIPKFNKNNRPDVILCNPPFAGMVRNIKNTVYFRTDKLYLYFLLKIMLDVEENIPAGESYIPTLYFICPKTFFKDDSHVVISKKMRDDMFKIFKGREGLDDILLDDRIEFRHQYQIISEVSGFKKIDKRGKISNLAMNATLFKIVL